MRVMAVDDERIALELLMRAVLYYDEDISLHTFRDPYKALEFLKKQPVDVAFVDVQMFGMNGVELAEKMMAACPRINIIFTTGYSDYMEEAFNLHVSGYILKPITAEKVRHELDHLRYAVESEKEVRTNVRVRCFGNFELYINGEVPSFKYSKTRELLAYLVDRKGSSCTSAEITAVLWEGVNHDSYLRNLRKDLMDTLAAAGCENLVRSVNGRMNIQVDQFECDYYNWLRDHSTVKYTGEYMNQYSWAEATNAYIDRQVNREGF